MNKKSIVLLFGVLVLLGLVVYCVVGMELLPSQYETIKSRFIAMGGSVPGVVCRHGNMGEGLSRYSYRWSLFVGLPNDVSGHRQRLVGSEWVTDYVPSNFFEFSCLVTQMEYYGSNTDCWYQ